MPFSTNEISNAAFVVATELPIVDFPPPPSGELAAAALGGKDASALKEFGKVMEQFRLWAEDDVAAISKYEIERGEPLTPNELLDFKEASRVCRAVMLRASKEVASVVRRGPPLGDPSRGSKSDKSPNIAKFVATGRKNSKARQEYYENLEHSRKNAHDELKARRAYEKDIGRTLDGNETLEFKSALMECRGAVLPASKETASFPRCSPPPGQILKKKTRTARIHVFGRWSKKTPKRHYFAEPIHRAVVQHAHVFEKESSSHWANFKSFEVKLDFKSGGVTAGMKEEHMIWQSSIKFVEEEDGFVLTEDGLTTAEVAAADSALKKAINSPALKSGAFPNALRQSEASAFASPSRRTGTPVLSSTPRSAVASSSAVTVAANDDDTDDSDDMTLATSVGGSPPVVVIPRRAKRGPYDKSAKDLSPEAKEKRRRLKQKGNKRLRDERDAQLSVEGKPLPPKETRTSRSGLSAEERRELDHERARQNSNRRREDHPRENWSLEELAADHERARDRAGAAVDAAGRKQQFKPSGRRLPCTEEEVREAEAKRRRRLSPGTLAHKSNMSRIGYHLRKLDLDPWLRARYEEEKADLVEKEVARRQAKPKRGESTRKEQRGREYSHDCAYPLPRDVGVSFGETRTGDPFGEGNRFSIRPASSGRMSSSSAAKKGSSSSLPPVGTASSTVKTKGHPACSRGRQLLKRFMSSRLRPGSSSRPLSLLPPRPF